MPMRSGPLERILTLAVLATVTFASPAAAASEPSARLVSCSSGSCLLVSGRRESPAATVMINGHAIPVQGNLKWRARLPVETVRAWSKPSARTIDVSILDTEAQSKTAEKVDLPIGLLGKTSDLAFLVISMK